MQPARLRLATLNLEQDHKRWQLRRELVVEQLGTIRPDLRRHAHRLRRCASRCRRLAWTRLYSMPSRSLAADFNATLGVARA